MINFNLAEFLGAIDDMRVAKTRVSSAPGGQIASDALKAFIQDKLAKIVNYVSVFAMPSALIRVERLLVIGMAPYTYDEIKREIDELLLAVERDAAGDFFCHYGRERIESVTRLEIDWGEVFRSFESAKPEIENGIDCYALGHNAACVFHMCRAAEVGLRAIGRERGVKSLKRKVPIEWGTWGQVFQAIEPTLEDIRKHRPNGPHKTNALVFYERVLSDLRTIQSFYRDQTMHLRDRYNDGETASAVFRVRELMTMLSSKLNENSIRQIPWSAWK